MIKIMLDTGSDSRKAEQSYDYMVPLSITFDEDTYLDGVDLQVDEFYDKLLNSDIFPKTAQPSPQQFADVFEEVKANGDELIYLCISAALSGTYQSATIAKDMVEYDKIHLVDTNTATHCIRILADYAMAGIKAGKCAEEIVAGCEDLKKRMKVFVGLDTLEFLYKGGRLSKASATVGSIAGIKPIVTLNEEGKVESAGKTLRKNKAIEFIIKEMEKTGIDTDYPIYSLYSYGTENSEKFEAALEKHGYHHADRLQLGSTIGTHVGQGVFGVVYVSKGE